MYTNRAKIWHDYSLGFGTICLAAATIATKAFTAAVATTEIDTATIFKTLPRYTSKALPRYNNPHPFQLCNFDRRM